MLHFRIFDDDGKVVVDADEESIKKKDSEIAVLRSFIKSLRRPHLMTESEKTRVIQAVTSIVDFPTYSPSYQPAVNSYIGSLNEMISMPSALVPSTGPGPVLTGDLRIILGPIDWPGVPLKFPSGVPPPVPNPFIEGRLKEGLFNYRDRLQVLIAAIEGAQGPYRHDPTTITLIRSALLETYRYMRNNAATNQMFQPEEVEKLAEMLFRRDLKGLIREREEFLKNLVVTRNRGLDDNWESQVTSTDVLAFVLSLQFASVDRQLKEDMRVMSERRGCACGDVNHLWFYEFYPSPEAKQAFNAYVACKWPLHVYSVDPAVEQQNVLDAFSRRSELQLALAVSVASGSMSANNATKFARRLEFDLETVGLNRTAVGFGAGETTFGWRFYPRVQTPRTESNPLRIANLLVWNGPGPNWDVKSRQIEPGQRECIAVMVVPNFIPALKISTVANWFDLTGHAARQQLENQQMLELSHGLQAVKNALAGVSDSRQYRPQDLVHVTQRIQQLESQLPTQDYRVDLPDEGDMLGSEIFSSNAATLAPMLVAWYGEPVKEGVPSSIFLLGRGFSVFETQVVAGGVNIPETQKRLISRNVLQIIIPRSARAVAVCCTDEDDDGDHEADGEAAGEGEPARDGAKPGKKKHPKSKGPQCARAVIDVHVATPNGISNHLIVDVTPKARPESHQKMSTTATTTTTVHGDQTSTTTKLEVTPPGIALPPLTIFPLGTTWPPNGTFQPAAVTGAPQGQVVPGLVPGKPERPEPPEPTLNLAPAPSVPTPAPTPKPTPAKETEKTKPKPKNGEKPKAPGGGTPAKAATSGSCTSHVRCGRIPRLLDHRGLKRRGDVGVEQLRYASICRCRREPDYSLVRARIAAAAEATCHRPAARSAAAANSVSIPPLRNGSDLQSPLAPAPRSTLRSTGSCRRNPLRSGFMPDRATA